MQPSTLRNTSQTRIIEAPSFEDGAFLRTIGADYVGSKMRGDRVILEFEANRDAEAALAKFRAGRNTPGDLASFVDSLRWAKGIIFAQRRARGADRAGFVTFSSR